MDVFFEKLSSCNTRPPTLSTLPGYALNYVLKSSLDKAVSLKTRILGIDLPWYVDHLPISRHAGNSWNVWGSRGRNKKTKKLQALVHLQSWKNNSIKMKSVCHSDPANPLKGLIKAICYPMPIDSHPTPLTGDASVSRLQEIPTLQKWERNMTDWFRVAESGFILNLQGHILVPHQMKLCCDCCGAGVLEIKCSYCHRTDTTVSWTMPAGTNSFVWNQDMMVCSIWKPQMLISTRSRPRFGYAMCSTMISVFDVLRLSITF